MERTCMCANAQTDHKRVTLIPKILYLNINGEWCIPLTVGKLILIHAGRRWSLSFGSSGHFRYQH